MPSNENDIATDAPPPKPPALRSFLLYHYVANIPDATSSSGEKARTAPKWYGPLKAVWDRFAPDMPVAWNKVPTDFPKWENVRGKRSETPLLSFRSAIETSDQAPDFAYVYTDHDALGFVLLVQSNKENDFDDLTRRLAQYLVGEKQLIETEAEQTAKQKQTAEAKQAATPFLGGFLLEWKNEPPNPRAAKGFLGDFLTFGVLYDENAPTAPPHLKNEVLADEPRAPFMTTDGLSYWNLRWHDMDGAQRLLIAAPRTKTGEQTAKNVATGPLAYAVPPLLTYQINTAKATWLDREIEREYGHDSDEPNSHKRWREIEAHAFAVQASGKVTPEDGATLDSERGELVVFLGDLRKQEITHQIASDKINQTRPRRRAAPASETPPPSDASETFDVYYRDSARRADLRARIEAEMRYIQATLETAQGLRAIHAANVEADRLVVEKKRVAQDADRNYNALVQTAIIGGIASLFTTISATADYDFALLKWPLNLLGGALGYAIPVLFLRHHETRKRGADYTAWAVLFGAVGALAVAYIQALYEAPSINWRPPLWHLGLIGFCVAAATWFWRRNAETRRVAAQEEAERRARDAALQEAPCAAQEKTPPPPAIAATEQGDTTRAAQTTATAVPAAHAPEVSPLPLGRR